MIIIQSGNTYFYTNTNSTVTNNNDSILTEKQKKSN